ncbi:MAG TPA: sensor histidine kinase N-terminal domain-containing protein [Nevskia sp.]|nr:sensor histidine kinase N-terminal domain-containing protein [Nevskia sp.]
MVLFGIGGLACYAFAVHYANTVYDGWLFDSVKSLTLVVERTDRGVTLDLPQSALRLFVWDVADTTYYRVVGTRSGFIAGRRDFPEAPQDSRKLGDYQGATLFDSFIDGEAVRVASLQLPQDQFGETVTVQVAETKNKRRKLAREVLASVLLPQVVLIGAAALMLWFGIRRGLAPLGSLAERLQAQDHRRLQPLSGDDVPLEVQPLTLALNDLLARLDSAQAAQRRFVADSAHQLRTPLTSLKLNMEQALQDAEGAGHPGLEEGVIPVLRECARAVDRVSRLSNQLLLLARAEPDAIATTPFERLDLAALARTVGAEWVPRALQRNIDISLVVAGEAVTVSGNPVLLSEALNNLLDNAIKYHPGGGRISIEVGAQPRPSVRVADDGPGIPPELREQVLKRFFRVDRSGREGSGLGLAIVQEIVRAHGGALMLGDGLDGRGLGALIVLP